MIQQRLINTGYISHEKSLGIHNIYGGKMGKRGVLSFYERGDLEAGELCVISSEK